MTPLLVRPLPTTALRPPAAHPAAPLAAATTAALALILVLLLALATASAAAPVEGDPPPEVPDTGAIPPVPGAVVRGFEAPDGPYGPGHRGVDLAAVPGQAVVAALDGTVVFSGTVAGTGWVTLHHGGGLVTTYGPLEDRIVEGLRVARGDEVGVVAGPPVGDPAGSVSVGGPAAHVDWGARLAGAYIDPLLLLEPWSLRLTDPARLSDAGNADPGND